MLGWLSNIYFIIIESFYQRKLHNLLLARHTQSAANDAAYTPRHASNRRSRALGGLQAIEAKGRFRRTHLATMPANDVVVLLLLRKDQVLFHPVGCAGTYRGRVLVKIYIRVLSSYTCCNQYSSTHRAHRSPPICSPTQPLFLLVLSTPRASTAPMPWNSSRSKTLLR